MATGLTEDLRRAEHIPRSWCQIPRVIISMIWARARASGSYLDQESVSFRLNMSYENQGFYLARRFEEYS